MEAFSFIGRSKGFVSLYRHHNDAIVSHFCGKIFINSICDVTTFNKTKFCGQTAGVLGFWGFGVLDGVKKTGKRMS